MTHNADSQTGRPEAKEGQVSFRYAPSKQEEMNSIFQARLPKYQEKRKPTVSDLYREAVDAFIEKESGAINAARSMVTAQRYLTKSDRDKSKGRMRADARDILHEAIGMRSGAFNEIKNLLDETRTANAAARQDGLSLLQDAISGFGKATSELLRAQDLRANSAASDFQAKLDGAMGALEMMSRRTGDLFAEIRRVTERLEGLERAISAGAQPVPATRTASAPATRAAESLPQGESPSTQNAPAAPPQPARSTPPAGLAPDISASGDPSKLAGSRDDTPADPPTQEIASQSATPFDWPVIWESIVKPRIEILGLPNQELVRSNGRKAKALSQVLQAAAKDARTGALPLLQSLLRKREIIAEGWPMHRQTFEAPQAKGLSLWIVQIADSWHYCAERDRVWDAQMFDDMLASEQPLTFTCDPGSGKWRAALPDDTEWVIAPSPGSIGKA